MKKDSNLRIIGKRGRVYLPEALLKSLRLAEGSIVKASGHNGALVLTPMSVTPALDPFCEERLVQKERLAEMTTREIYELAAAAAAEYQLRMEEMGS